MKTLGCVLLLSVLVLIPATDSRAASPATGVGISDGVTVILDTQPPVNTNEFGGPGGIGDGDLDDGDGDAGTVARANDDNLLNGFTAEGGSLDFVDEIEWMIYYFQMLVLLGNM